LLLLLILAIDDVFTASKIATTTTNNCVDGFRRDKMADRKERRNELLLSNTIRKKVTMMKTTKLWQE
jgi:hypothetical protein